MNKWATIIYGRTYEVDFRLLTRPEDFDDKSIQWAKSHILVTTRYAEKLPQNQRWTIFQNDQYRIVGLTCMTSELSENMNADKAGRPLFVFVGFVSYKKDNLSIPAMDETYPFKEAYEKHVHPRWLEKEYQTREADIISVSKYEFELNRKNVVIEKSCGDEIFNFNPEKVRLWADTLYYRKFLWSAAAHQERNFSLCLGLARQKDASEGPILNASVADVKEFEILKNVVDSYQHSQKAQTKSASDMKKIEIPKDEFPKPKQHEDKKVERQIHSAKSSDVDVESDFFNKALETFGKIFGARSSEKEEPRIQKKTQLIQTNHLPGFRSQKTDKLNRK